MTTERESLPAALYDEGVHWTCYCADQPRCCEIEGACCVGCDDERDHRVFTDYCDGDEDG